MSSPVTLTIDATDLNFTLECVDIEEGQEWNKDCPVILVSDDEGIHIIGTEDDILDLATNLVMEVYANQIRREHSKRWQANQ